MEYIKQNSYKGTNIIIGNEKRNYINNCISFLHNYQSSFEEIQIPIIQYQEIFNNKVGVYD